MLQNLNIIAVDNKAENERAYDTWIKSHTPEQIRLANVARSSLRRQARTSGTGTRRVRYRKITDSRQVKAPKTARSLYFSERVSAGVFHNIPMSTALKLANDEYKTLNGPDKKVSEQCLVATIADLSKKYEDLAEAEKMRYSREYQSTYGHPPPSKPKAKIATA